MDNSPGKANLLGKRELKDDVLETNPILKKHKEISEEEEKETTKVFSDDSLQHQIKGRVELLLETNSDQANNLIPVKEEEEETVERLDETPDFLKSIASLVVRKKTLFVDHLAVGLDMSDIINFFKDFGQVVSVQLTLNHEGKRTSSGFVEFASANEAKKAQEMKNGKLWCGNNITLLLVAEIAPYPPRPKNIDHLRQESLPIEEDEEETPPYFVETVAKIRKTLFVANLSPQTKLSHIINFFQDVGEVVSLRLIVNPEGKHVGYGFVEFASPCVAKKALEEKNGEYLHDHRIFLDVAKTAPYSPRSKCNLVEKLWYEDYLLRESRLVVEDETMEGLDETHIFVQAVVVRKKTLCVSHFPNQAKISDIINFFKDVATIVHVRLAVNHKGKQLFHNAFVEFSSANDANKALEKDSEYLLNRKIHLDVAKAAPYSLRPKYCIDHKVWYEDYIRQESLLIEEDETMEGLDETPNFVEEVAVRKKTLYIANLPLKIKIQHIIDFFKDVGEVFSVRLIVNHMGKHVGCGFVEFASANEAKKALQKKNQGRLQSHFVFLDVAEIAPYPLRPKYDLAEKLWYEDYQRRESLLIEEDDLETKPTRKMKLFGVYKQAILDSSCGKKITFSDDTLIEEDEALCCF
ncbi:PREDICTED: polyadenylate-binding protein 1-like [Camelina sativa]|uniref:Polyadenylate-binding protein 1-like n=1 Tax=Camelina sativa TaxID=90675 RepID=A0ABM0SKU1_CAMSA|nr:PREDICTED: polyadenylate-binding protein 1-like [Camelina sativa]